MLLVGILLVLNAIWIVTYCSMSLLVYQISDPTLENRCQPEVSAVLLDCVQMCTDAPLGPTINCWVLRSEVNL